MSDLDLFYLRKNGIQMEITADYAYEWLTERRSKSERVEFTKEGRNSSTGSPNVE
jgi:hypothetical protein